MYREREKSSGYERKDDELRKKKHNMENMRKILKTRKKLVRPKMIVL